MTSSASVANNIVKSGAMALPAAESRRSPMLTLISTDLYKQIQDINLSSMFSCFQFSLLQTTRWWNKLFLLSSVNWNWNINKSRSTN